MKLLEKFSFCFLFLQIVFASTPAKYVNPFIGTGGHGHTFPGATVPFGMVQLSPDTRVEGWDACGGYHYSDKVIRGFSHTHLSGTGVADYGDILLMPTVGPIDIANYRYKALFVHKSEKSSPGYYSVKLIGPNVLAELTATKHVGVHRYTYPPAYRSNLIIDLVHGLGPDKVIDSKLEFISETEVAGYRFSNGWAKNQKLYFVIQLSEPCKSFAFVEKDSVSPSFPEASGEHLKMYLRFNDKGAYSLMVKVGLSTVSVEGARKNIQAEVPGWDFDEVKNQAEQAWNTELGKIEVEGGTDNQKTIFYTSLYHAMIAPNIMSDVDGQYRGMDGQIHKADGFDMYTVFSLWDTFRAEHPLLTIIDQKRTLDFIKSFLAKYDESGTLPVWELASNETWCMIGYHSVPVIVDAYMKGIRNFDTEKALKAMMASANANRYGLDSYRTYGYVPGDKEGESVSKTLEYSYDDWCIAQFAKELGKMDIYNEFSERAQYYKNIYDASTGFMRAKANGTWATPFNPTSVTFHYTEANAWQYSFFVPQDIPGFINLLGGKSQFSLKLDSLFGSSSRTTGREQSDISGMIGQYAQGNEPSHHVAYLYDYSGSPWKTQRVVRRIMDSLFTSKPDGICGNDDCGQMSAWYVMSAMGLYEVCPGNPTYAIGSPLFNKITIHQQNGKDFIIQAKNNSKANKYIQSATLDGIAKKDPFISHNNISAGGKLILTMSGSPNKKWGTTTTWLKNPPNEKQIVTVPYIESTTKTFSGSTNITLLNSTAGATIRYTTDGTTPNDTALLYTTPVLLKKTTTIKAIALKYSMINSKVMIAEFIEHKSIGHISLINSYDPQYIGGGDNALLDGLKGGIDFRHGEWQGYHETDLDAIIELDSLRDINYIALNCLQDQNSWIFFPQSVEFSFSADGAMFSNIQIVKNDTSPQENGASIKEFGISLTNMHARFIRIHAKNMGQCPSWHPGAGQPAWLFTDEVIVK